MTLEEALYLYVILKDLWSNYTILNWEIVTPAMITTQEFRNSKQAQYFDFARNSDKIHADQKIFKNVC